MSQFSEKELALMTAMVKNFSGSLLASVSNSSLIPRRYLIVRVS